MPTFPPYSLSALGQVGPAEPDVRSQTAAVREHAVTHRESTMRVREEAASVRDDLQREHEAESHVARSDLSEANGHLVLAYLHATQQKEAAEHTQARQQELLAMLGHELRNPLAPIRNAAALLASDSLTPESLTTMQLIIDRQVGHMSRLLDDLLDASRVTNGKVHLRKCIVPIKEPLNQAVEQCAVLLQEQKHTLTVSMPTEDCFVDGDPARLLQIFANLLHNAIKYTAPGGRIALTARASEGAVVVEVADNGVGIAADALPHIFEMFQQENRSLDRSLGGLGLGLTIVRSMVDLHGGRIAAKSDGLGLGSTFVVTLALVAAPEAPASPQAEAELPPLRVLLVDDNADARVTLCTLFELAGHDPETAPDGPTALEKFDRHHPHVVVCDIGLPGMSGYEVAQHMRSGDSGHTPMLIALTGYDGPGRRERAIAAGFDCQLAKPAGFPEILEAIRLGLTSR
ncbi:ATP-binding protein [Sphingomonas sp. NCPPB 2930]